MSEKISIVMPTFKQSKYIKESINSILSQSYKNIEIIIVPVYGDKKTIDIITKYKNSVKTIVSNYALITHQMNLGAFAATGKWFMFFASDDFLCKNSLEKMYNFVEEKSTVILYPDFYIGNKDLDIKYIKQNPNWEDKKSLLKSSFITDVSLVDRKELITFMPMLCSDGKARIRNLWVKMSLEKKYKDKIKRYPYPTFIYRQHNNSVHLHKSQNNFCEITIKEDFNNFINIDCVSVKNIDKKHYCIFICEPNLYLKYKNYFRYKKIVIWWQEKDITFLNNKYKFFRHTYNVTNDANMSDVFKKFNLLFWICSKEEIKNFILEDSVDILKKEINLNSLYHE